MFDPLVNDLSQRYGLGDRGRDLFGLLVAYIHNDRRGGFGGFVEGFREQGHGELLSSWLGNPEASGLTAGDVGTVFGQGLLNDWGTRLGVSRATVAAAIAGVLPRLVAELTPSGRIPGGFTPVYPVESGRGIRAVRETAARQDEGAGAVPQSFSVRPGVEGLVVGDVPDARSSDAITEPLARVVPSEDKDSARDPDPVMPPPTGPAEQPVWHPEAESAASVFPPRQPLAPDPSPNLDRPSSPQPALRKEPLSPAATPRTPVETRPALDPAEQRIADMTAALDRAPQGSRSDPAPFDRQRPEGWRPAVHPPKKRGLGWLVWLLLLLAVLAGAGWYAWTQGLLDPYIRQYNLPLRTVTPAP